MKTNKCKHKNACRFHPSAPLYCEDCKKYLEYKDVNNNGKYSLVVLEENKK